MKRLFDLLAAALGLLFLAPLFAVIAACIRLDSEGPVFFRQERIGRGFAPFFILKFRTMVREAPRLGGQLTAGEDPRITRVGRLLRRTKLDELPQLINVLRGEMSFVGPRPEVRKYVEMFREDYAAILSVRPGITDPASLRFRDESTLLGRAADPEAEYVRTLLPEKIRLAKKYAATRSFAGDLGLILATVYAVACHRSQEGAA